MAVVEQRATLSATLPTLKPSPPQLVPYRWPKGFCPNPKGRPRGSSAATLLERAETRVAKKYIHRALDDHFKDQGNMLRHAMDKYVPNAGVPLDAGTVSTPLISITFGTVPVAEQ